MTISLSGVTKQFEESGKPRKILRDITLEVNAGEFVSLMGPSGSGKSTLLNLVGGIDQADSGEIVVAGQSLTTLTEHQLALFRRRHVGFVFQFFNLIPTLTVRENILLPLSLVGRRDGDEEIDRWLTRVGLSDRAASYPDVLSGGEQQRVAIVRAAIHSPDVILADEPTGNLDQSAGDSILKLLQELSGQGITILMATHSASAAALASRRYVMRDGMLEASG